MKASNNISELSSHLFWDLDKSKLSVQGSKNIIVERVLDFGLISDWNWIVATYGIEEIIETAIHLKNLTKLSATFLSTFFNIEKEKFECYKSDRSTLNFLNY